MGYSCWTRHSSEDKGMRARRDHARTSVSFATQTQTMAHERTSALVINSGAWWTLKGGAVLKWCFGRATCV